MQITEQKGSGQEVRENKVSASGQWPSSGALTGNANSIYFSTNASWPVSTFIFPAFGFWIQELFGQTKI